VTWWGIWDGRQHPALLSSTISYLTQRIWQSTASSDPS